MTIPNALSLLRIAAIPLFAYFLLTQEARCAYIAAGIFAVLVLTDAVDGYLARRLNAVTTFGKYVDPLADKILVITALIALVELGKVSSVPVAIIAAREFAVTAFRLAAVEKGKVIAANLLGKTKTVTQMAAVFFLILGWPYGEVLLWAAAALTILSGAAYIYKAWGEVFGS